MRTKTIGSPRVYSTEKLYRRIGEQVAFRRLMQGMTQGDLAEAIGLSRTSIANIESGRQRMLVHTLHEVARLLKVEPESLWR